MNRKPILTKPYVVPINIDNRPLPPSPRLTWVVKTADSRKSFSFCSGSEFVAMRIWRTQCGGSEIIDMYSYETKQLI